MENREIAIQIDGLKKMYKLGQIGGGTLQGDLQSWWAKIRGKEDPNSKIGVDQRSYGKSFMALNGIDLTIYKGEAIGIIGHNGAGKSTLLKLLSRVTAPTNGTIGINGRIASMLEVGTGFNGEMTGRENIYMNGAILGMTKAEIDAKMEQIIEFSEVREFIDTPVKRYSSGMYVKLAFSVAAHLDSEIMIMDEVLAVGDMAFQKKCLKKMKDASMTDGKTVLYVSHNMNTISQLCNRCVVMNQGKIEYIGDVDESIRRYMKNYTGEMSVNSDLSELDRPGNSLNKVRITRICYPNKMECIYQRGETIQFDLEWKSEECLEDVRCRIIVGTQNGTAIGLSFSKPICNALQGEKYITKFAFDSSVLTEGKYIFSIALYQSDEVGNSLILDHVTWASSFELTSPKNDSDMLKWETQWWGSTRLPELAILEDINT